MSALLVFSMWPTGATRALAEAIAPQDSQEAVEEVYESEAQEQQAVAGDQAVNEAQAADEAKAAAEAEAAAAAEAERATAEQAAADQAAAEQAAADQAAADQAAAEQAAAEAEANRQVNVGIDVSNATLHYNGQAFTAPTESITVPAHAAFVFSVAPVAGYDLKAVKTLVDGQETELHADAQGLYTVSEATLDSNVTVKVVTEPTAQSEPAPAPEVVAPAGDASQDQNAAETSADEPKTDEGAADTVAPSEGSATATEGQAPAGDTAAGANGAATVAETGNGEADVNAVAASATEQTVEVGKTITLTSSYSRWYSHAWTSDNNAWTSDNNDVATVDGSGSTATVTGVAVGDAVITDTVKSWYDETTETVEYTIHVVAATPATSVSISGESSVTQFSTLQLTAVTDPAHASGTASWASSNEAILTVDESGLVTGLRQGTATVSLTFTNADGSSVIATKDITVAAVTEATDQAGVYYLLDPTKDANSNDTGHWGPQYGIATVNVTGATWSNGKNCFDNVDQRVVSWPNGTNVVPRGSDAWNQIYENYKSVIQAQLPDVEFTEDDVEEISLVPAKISKNNQSNPDKHLDCNVSIKCKGVALVKYYLRDAGSTQFALLGSQNYVKGDETNLSDVYNGSLPETKVVDGVTYTFSGWYLDQDFTQPATLPYTVNDSTNFYAKYVGGYQVIYDLAGGTWGSSDATMYTAQEGSTQTVRHEPTLEGFKFAGWTVTGLDGVTTLASGATFTMPSHNVTLTATWEPLVSYQVKYLENGTNVELATADTRYGELGKDYTETAKTIDGYHLIGSAEKTHTIAEGDNTVKFWYEKDSVSYTVNYYLNGTVINVADPDTKSAAWGSVVSVADCAKTIDGYTVVPGQDATITVNRDGSNVINVYYYKNVSLIANSDTKTYNGLEQSVSGFTGAPEGADFSAITVGAAGTNVGKYGAIFAKGTVGTVDATGKYIVTEAKNGGLLITPYANEIVIKIKGATDSKTYDGTEQSVEGFTVESISTKLITKDQVVLRTDVAAKATGTKVGTYTMGLAGTSFTLADGVSGNFTSASIRFDVTDGALTITKRPVTLKSADLSKEYDGTPLVNGATPVEVSGDGWAAGEGATYAFTGTQTAVGSSANAFTYTLNSNTKAENYTITKEDGTLTVKDRAEKYKATIKANSATVTYDGKTHEAKGLESTTVIANGHMFTVEGLTTTNSKGTGVGAEGIDAGEYANKIMGTPVIRDAAGNDVTSQFEVTTVDGKLTIAKRDVTIKPMKASKQYDGTALVATDFEVVSGSFAEGEGIESCTYAGQQIQVGTSGSTIETVKPKANTNLDKNYNLRKDPGALTVTNRDADAKYKIEVEAKSATATYDGEEHVASGLVTDKFTIKDKFTNKDVEYTVSGLTAEVKGTDAGTYRNFIVGTAKVTDPAGNDVTDQFVVSTKSGNLEIAKRPVTLTSADATKAYDGTALTNDKVTVSGDGFVKGQGATFDVTGFQTVVGESNNSFTYALNEGTNPNNYTITKSEGTLKVTANEQAVVVKVKGNTNTQLYDGAEHVATGYIVEGVTVDGVASDDLYGAKAGVDFTFKGTASAKRTDAGKTDMGLKAEQFTNINKNFSNVTFEIVEDGSVTITKRAVTLTSASAYKTYDGTALVKDEVTVSGDGFVMGQGATYSVTGSQTNAGESFNTFSYTLNKGTNADNYTIATHEGTLVVNPVMASVVVTIVGNHASGTYNGKELSASGYIFSSNNELYTQDKVVFSGTAEAKRTDAGKTDMGLKADQFSNGDAVNFKNVVFKVSDGYVDIAKAQVTLKSADLHKQYDGTALVNGDAALETETGWAEGEGATYTFTGSQTTVGKSLNAFTYTLNEGTKAENYTIDKIEGVLSVRNRDAKYEVTVKANSTIATYDGKVHEAAGVETYVFEIDGVTYTVSGLSTQNPSKTDVGEYANNIIGTPVVTDGAGNVVTDQFMVKTENGKLVINQAEVTLISASGEWTYDGTKHSKHEMETVSGFAEGEGATFTYSASITNVGKVENAFVYKLNANTKSSNYKFTTNNGTLKVTPVTDKVTVTITGNSKTESYDGTEKTVTGYTVFSDNAAYTEANIKFTGTAVAKGTVVGTYDMGLSADQFSNVSDNFTNVEFIVHDGKLTITGGQIDVAGVDWVTQDEQKVYDGDPLSAHEATATDKNGNALKVEYSVDGKTWVSDPAQVNLTHFGHQTVMLRATGPNYAEGQYATSSESIAITKRLVTLTSEGANKKYDGTALTNGTVTATPKGAGVGFVDGEGVTITVTGSQTAVGESDNTFTYVFNEGTNPADYQVTSKYGKLIVTANDSEVVVTITEHSGSFVYDGTEKTVEGYDFAVSNPLYTQADFEFSGDATVRGTDAGEYDMQLEPGNFKNTSASFSKVTFVVVDGTLTITPKGIEPSGDNGMTVGTLPDVVYNGTEQAQKPVVKDGDKTLVEGEDYELSYSANITNAGTVTVTVTGKGSYTGRFDVTYKILKRQVVLTSGSQTWPYDGQAHSLTAVSGWQQSGDTGFVDGEVADVRATGTVTYVADGKVTNAIAYTELAGFKAENYQITKHEGTLEVTPATGKVVVTITEHGGSYTYDGTEKSAEGYDFVASDPLYTQADFAFTGDATVRGTDAGTYEMQLKSSDFANTNTNFAEVEFVVVDSELTIARRTVTLTSADGAKVYDGIALTKNEQSDVTVTGGEGFVAGETLAYEISGTQTVVGSSENTFVATSSETAKVDNYDVTYAYGTLTVSAQSIVPDPENPDTFKGVTVDDPADSVYDSQQHKWYPAVTGAMGNALVEGEDYTVSYDKDDFTNVTGDITVTITGMGNYTGTVTKTYKITKAPLAVAALSASKVYDGSALTAGGTIDGLVADETAQAVTSGSQTEVGSSANVVDSIAWGTALESNYYIASQTDGTLTVTPKGIAPEPGNGMTVGELPDVVYNGSEQAQKPSVMDGETELVEGVDYDLTYSEDLTNAGTVTVTVTGKGNYAGGVDVTYQITPATLTVSTPSASKVYDGDALAAEGSVSGFVAGESAPFATTGSQTLVGSSTNTYAIDWAAEGATAKQSNYVISEELGTLTVTDGTDDDPVDPSLVINKTHEDGTYALGDTVDFTLTATNVYDEARTMTFVEQEGVEIIGQTVFENVEPGTTVSTTARYTVTEADILAGGFTNTATVTFEGGKAFDGKDDVVVEKVENALEVTKTIGSAPADGVSFNEGETVSFVVTVTNKGNQTLKDVQVTDKLAGAFLTQGESDLIESLAPGESATLHYGYTITANDLGKEFRNVAVATAGNGTTDEGESPVIPVAPMSPEPNPDQNPDSKPGSGKPAIPKTADETPDGLMAALANLGLASLAAGLACLFVIPRRREN